jgi:predicted HAD superfamily phosphohydrolase YqeG
MTVARDRSYWHNDSVSVRAVLFDLDDTLMALLGPTGRR